MVGSTWLREMLEGVAHLFYPVYCPGCGSDGLQEGQFLCVLCNDDLPYTGFINIRDNTIEKIFLGRINIEAAASLLYFSKGSVIQQLMHQFKYEGKKEIGLYFGRRIGEALIQAGRFGKVGALVPLPLHVSRERKRGYNQAAVLCEGISEVTHWPVERNLVRRRKATQTQTFRSRTERWENMEQVFEVVDSDHFAGRHLLLVDDVITTGATLEACGSQLLKIPNAKLSIVTLAFTIL